MSIKLVHTDLPWTLLKQQNGLWTIECARIGVLVAKDLTKYDATFIVHIANSYKD